MKKSKVLSRMLVLTLLIFSLAGTFAYAAVPTVSFVDLPDFIFENPLSISVNVINNISNPQLYVNNSFTGVMNGSNGSYYLTWTPPDRSGAYYTIEVRASGTNGTIASARKTIWVSAYSKETKGIATTSPYRIIQKGGTFGTDCLGYVLGSSSPMKLSDWASIRDYDNLLRGYGYYRVSNRSQAVIIAYGEYYSSSNTYVIKHFAKKTGDYTTLAKLGRDGEVVELYSQNPYNSMWGNEVAYYNYSPYF